MYRCLTSPLYYVLTTTNKYTGINKKNFQTTQVYNKNLTYDCGNVFTKFVFINPNYYWMENQRLIVKTKKAFSLRCISKDKIYVKGSTYGVWDLNLTQLNKFVNTQFQKGEVFEIERNQQWLKVSMVGVQNKNTKEMLKEAKDTPTIQKTIKNNKSIELQIKIQPIQILQQQKHEQAMLKQNALANQQQIKPQTIQQSVSQQPLIPTSSQKKSSLLDTLKSIQKNKIKSPFCTTSSPKSQKQNNLIFDMKTQTHEYKFELPYTNYKVIKKVIEQSINQIYGVQSVYDLQLKDLIQRLYKGQIEEEQYEIDPNRFSL